MQKKGITTALLGKNGFRFKIHGESEIIDNKENLPAEESLQVKTIEPSEILPDAYRVQKGGVKFIYHPPVGQFRINFSDKDFLSGTIQNSNFENASIFLNGDYQDKYYGFGEVLLKPQCTGQSFYLFNQNRFNSHDSGAGNCHPFFIIQKKNQFLGVFLNTATPLKIQILKDPNPLNGSGIRLDFLESGYAPVDIYLFWGTPREIIQNFTLLSGRPSTPPLWALGHHFVINAKNSVQLLEIAKRFQKEHIPCDALHLGNNAFEPGKFFSWNLEHYSNAGTINKEIDKIGIKIVTQIEARVPSNDNYDLYAEGKSRNVFCLDNTGKLFNVKLSGKKFSFPDFSSENGSQWWADRHNILFANHVSGIANINNEPPEIVISHGSLSSSTILNSGKSHIKYINQYGNLVCKATVTSFKKFQPEKRPFILTNTSYCGIQKDATVLAGDSLKNPDDLRDNLQRILNLGLSGISLCGMDPEKTAKNRSFPFANVSSDYKFFIRWMEIAGLMPFFGVDSDALIGNCEPWKLPARFQDLYKTIVNRRYALLPYYYALFKESKDTGIPLIRSLLFDYPKLKSEEHPDIFFIGSSILVAPEFSSKKSVRSVRFPPGEWFDYYSREMYIGNKTYEISALPGYIPLFIKGGTIMPICKPEQTASKTLFSEITLELFPAKEMSGVLYLDDGISTIEGEGNFFMCLFHGNNAKKDLIELSIKECIIKYSPPYKTLKLELPENFKYMQYSTKRISGQRKVIESNGRNFAISSFNIPLDTNLFPITFSAA